MGGNGAAGRASLTYIDGTCVEMLAAKTVRRNNTSGTPGVDRRPSGKWRAFICFKGQRIHLGTYADLAEAVAARKKAEAELHDEFVKRHGRKNARRWTEGGHPDGEG